MDTTDLFKIDELTNLNINEEFKPINKLTPGSSKIPNFSDNKFLGGAAKKNKKPEETPSEDNEDNMNNEPNTNDEVDMNNDVKEVKVEDNSKETTNEDTIDLINDTQEDNNEKENNTNNSNDETNNDEVNNNTDNEKEEDETIEEDIEEENEVNLKQKLNIKNNNNTDAATFNLKTLKIKFYEMLLEHLKDESNDVSEITGEADMLLPLFEDKNIKLATISKMIDTGVIEL